MFLSLSLKLLVFVVFLLAAVTSQNIETEFNNPCGKMSTCGECIQASKLCAWCGSETVPREFSRCDLLDNLRRHCDEADITNPKSNLNKEKTKDADWTSGSLTEPPVQVKPQLMHFNLRPNDPMNFKLHFRQQANYPVDLYFLLDLSYGMFREKEAQNRLIALGESIPVSMAHITNNFKLGFGTFVDKLLMPYTAWTDQMLQDRCPLKKECRKPHDYKHQVNLGGDTKDFADKMKLALESVSQSLDDAEGGMDGLIQALDCDLIGWRNVSRRIIVYSSNSLFHLSGSGKLGGATKQSDLKCDLNSDGEYRGEKIYDFPSVSQIAYKLRAKNANVIFAVMGDVTGQYQLLGNFLDGAVVGKLEDDSNNIVELIKQKYYELRSQITFKAVDADDVNIVLKSKCKGDVLTETDKCEELEIGEAVEFDVTLSVSKDVCHKKNGIVKKQVLLDAVGLNEQLVINLSIQCSCECEGSDEEVRNSTKCSSAGTLECGICTCNPGQYGKNCECDEATISSEKSLNDCRNKNESITCSGHGECVCGKCYCYPIDESNKDEEYTGRFCNCNDFNCPYALVDGKRQRCAGRGSCKCGKCNCNSEWSGPKCTCPTRTDTCIASNGLLCNGKGVCECGRCACNTTTSFYGPTCEDCPNCASQCNAYKDCAQCKAHKSGIYDIDECNLNCRTTEVKDDLPSGKDIERCEARDVDGCKFFFSYEYTAENDVHIVAQITKDCPAKANIEAIIGGTVAAVVIIPLLIICLIIFARNRRDAKEYAEFIKDKDKAHWDTTANPIYKDPKSTFQNPTYKGGKN